jgi:hypothetical protein
MGEIDLKKENCLKVAYKKGEIKRELIIEYTLIFIDHKTNALLKYL